MLTFIGSPCPPRAARDELDDKVSFEGDWSTTTTKLANTGSFSINSLKLNGKIPAFAMELETFVAGTYTVTNGDRNNGGVAASSKTVVSWSCR